ncbi:hypothetical protein PNBC_05980 [Paenibacillus crassostreae]|uniref:Uncharacterized protein n=1 Tax=Paenibacillus crassostreae TaxID=1763538 RepID=A0A167FVC7_9BACL|nr:hypothetical protein LPB68_18755 [Paenibacillus crassostreae]OAB76941.1 hypothetical protein PNBC_05980 [Paenibacillus crassostreae]
MGPGDQADQIHPETPFSDPFYDLPHFNELFTLQTDEQDNDFWEVAAFRQAVLGYTAAHRGPPILRQLSKLLQLAGSPLC